MIFIILTLVVITIFLSSRIFYLEKQIVSLTKQLTDINENRINKKVTIGLINKKIEKLAEKINETIQIKMQCEANKVKLENNLRQTIANMSHDLRTPLTSIIGYIQFLKLDKISMEERNEYLEIAESRAKALEALINDFYELSLIDSLDYELNMERLNINKVLQEVILGRYADFVNRNIKPNIEIPNVNIYIIADLRSLERVIENLISNSIKYARDTISISLQKEENSIILIVSNTFTTLTQEDVENIFDRFYIADKTRSGKGTGLGLAIAKGLVEKMGGTIWSDIKDDMFNICCRFESVDR